MLYKFVTANVFLYLIVYEIKDLKREKTGDKKNDLRNLRRHLDIVDVGVFNIHSKSKQKKL